MWKQLDTMGRGGGGKERIIKRGEGRKIDVKSVCVCGGGGVGRRERERENKRRRGRER